MPDRDSILKLIGNSGSSSSRLKSDISSFRLTVWDNSYVGNNEQIWTGDNQHKAKTTKIIIPSW